MERYVDALLYYTMQYINKGIGVGMGQGLGAYLMKFSSWFFAADPIYILQQSISSKRPSREPFFLSFRESRAAGK